MAGPVIQPDRSNPVFGGAFNNPTAWQWQPIAYGDGAAHDPNPPLLIEDPTPVAATGTPTKAMMGCGF